MDLQRQLLWIIPNDQYEDRNLNDGEGIFYEYKVGNKDHKALGQDFCKKYGLTGYLEGGNHTDWGKYFSEKGFAVFFNSGMRVDGKYYGQWYLPETLTEKQIEFIENNRPLFNAEYHHQNTFFRVFSYTTEPLTYKGPSGLRDLRIEAQINGIPLNSIDGVDLLYQEIDAKKEKLDSRRR